MQDAADLYRAYYRDIFKFILKLSGGDAALAEELTQDTFYRALIGLSKFRGACHIKTWLCRIGKNTYFKYLREEHKKQGFAALSQQAVEPESNGPQQRAEKNEVAGRIQALIRSFPSPMRDVMIYRLYAELPYSQIARMLHITENSAKVIYFRGKVKLQSGLKEVYHDEG